MRLLLIALICRVITQQTAYNFIYKVSTGHDYCQQRECKMNQLKLAIEKIISHKTFKNIDQDALIQKVGSKAEATKKYSELKPSTPATKGPSKNPSGSAPGDISEIPAEGIKITQSGLYLFTQTINWSAPDATCAAITIEANDVTIDLCGHELSATVGDSSQNIVGIYTQNTKNICITNGTLINMCLHGVQANHVEDLIISKLLISGLAYSNLNIRGACPSGITVYGGSKAILDDCNVQYGYFTADSCTGIQLSHTEEAIVRNCSVDNMINYAGSVQGFSYILSNFVKTLNCHSSNFQSHFGGNIRAVGHTVIGFLPMACTVIEYTNCSSSKLTGCNDDCHGMSAFICLDITVSHFKAQHIIDGVCPENTGAKATGVEIYGVDATLINCSVDSIKAINPQDKQCAGFSFWGVGIKVTNCTASNILVCDQQGNYNTSIGYGMGFAWAPDPRKSLSSMGANFVTYDHCQAINCQVGFDTWSHIDSVWKNVSYSNCDINLLVQPGGKRILSGNLGSECNPPITTLVDNIARDNVYPLQYEV